MPLSSPYLQAQLQARQAAGRLTADAAQRVVGAISAHVDQLTQRLAQLPTGTPAAQRAAVEQARVIALQLRTDLQQALHGAIAGNRTLAYGEVLGAWQKAGQAVAATKGVPSALLGAIELPNVPMAGAYERLGGGAKTWKNSLLLYTTQGYGEIDAIVRTSLLQGAEPADLARRLRPYVEGAAPFQHAFPSSDERWKALHDHRNLPPELRGAAYRMRVNSLRIAYSEVHNARAEAELLAFAADPYVHACQWELSPYRGTQSKPDACDLLAKNDFYGLGPGVYPLDAVPLPPHPRDRCERVPVERAEAQLGDPKPTGLPRVLNPKDAKFHAGQRQLERLSKAEADAIRQRLAGQLALQEAHPSTAALGQLLKAAKAQADDLLQAIATRQEFLQALAKGTGPGSTTLGGDLVVFPFQLEAEALAAAKKLYQQAINNRSMAAVKALGDLGADVTKLEAKVLAKQAHKNAHQAAKKAAKAAEEAAQQAAAAAAEQALVTQGDELYDQAADVKAWAQGKYGPTSPKYHTVAEAIDDAASDAADAATAAGLTPGGAALEVGKAAAEAAQKAKGWVQALDNLEGMPQAQLASLVEDSLDATLGPLASTGKQLVQQAQVAEAAVKAAKKAEVIAKAGEPAVLQGELTIHHPLLDTVDEVKAYAKAQAKALGLDDVDASGVATMYHDTWQQGLQAGQPHFSAKLAAKQAAQQLLEDLKAAAAAPPAPVNVGDHIMHKWVANKGGSSKGGVYEAADGTRWMVKEYPEAGQGAAEALANTIYNRLGLGAPESVVFERKGVAYFASKMLDGVDASKELGKLGLTQARAREALRGFAADVLTANWDAYGLTGDNMVELGGKVFRIDNGSAFLYRATGAKKWSSGAYTKADLGKLGEWDTLANPAINAEYSKLFKAAGYTKADDLAEEAVSQITAILNLEKDVGGWAKLVDEVAPTFSAADRADVVAMLEARSALLAQKRAKLLADLAGQKPAPVIAPAAPPAPLPTPAPAAKPYAGWSTTQLQQEAKDHGLYGLTKKQWGEPGMDDLLHQALEGDAQALQALQAKGAQLQGFKLKVPAAAADDIGAELDELLGPAGPAAPPAAPGPHPHVLALDALDEVSGAGLKWNQVHHKLKSLGYSDADASAVAAAAEKAWMDDWPAFHSTASANAAATDAAIKKLEGLLGGAAPAVPLPAAAPGMFGQTFTAPAAHVQALAKLPDPPVASGLGKWKQVQQELDKQGWDVDVQDAVADAAEDAYNAATQAGKSLVAANVDANAAAIAKLDELAKAGQAAAAPPPSPFWQALDNLGDSPTAATKWDQVYNQLNGTSLSGFKKGDVADAAEQAFKDAKLAGQSTAEANAAANAAAAKKLDELTAAGPATPAAPVAPPAPPPPPPAPPPAATGYGTSSSAQLVAAKIKMQQPKGAKNTAYWQGIKAHAVPLKAADGSLLKFKKLVVKAVDGDPQAMAQLEAMGADLSQLKVKLQQKGLWSPPAAAPVAPHVPAQLLVTEAQVPGIQAASQVPQPLYWNGSNTALQAMKAGGIDWSKAPKASPWDFGFHLDTTQQTLTAVQKGTLQLQLASKAPLKVKSLAELDKRIEQIYGYPNWKVHTQAEVRQKLLASGYDAVVVEDLGKVIVLDEKALKVVDKAVAPLNPPMATYTPPSQTASGAAYSGGDRANLPADNVPPPPGYIRNDPGTHQRPVNDHLDVHMREAEMTAAEKQAVHYYTTTSGYSALNTPLRRGQKLTPALEAKAKEIDKITTRREFKADVVLYRGVKDNPDPTFAHPLVKALKSGWQDLQDMVGEVIEDMGIVSTSTSQDRAAGFMDHWKVMMEVRVPRGSRGGVWAKKTSAFGGDSGEQEVIFKRNTRVRILEIREEQGHSSSRPRVRVICEHVWP